MDVRNAHYKRSPTLINILHSVDSEIKIITPFISISMTKRLSETLKSNPKISCTVITRFYRDDFIQGASDIEAMLGSANFTSGGFFLNHELSVLLEEDEEVLNDIELKSIKWTPKVRLYAAPAA